METFSCALVGRVSANIAKSATASVRRRTPVGAIKLRAHCAKSLITIELWFAFCDYWEFCQFANLLSAIRFASSSERSPTSELLWRDHEDTFHSRCSVGSTFCGSGSCADCGSHRAASAGSSGCGWPRSWSRIRLGRRIPALDGQWLCVGRWKVGASATRRCGLGLSPLRSKWRWLDVLQGILAVAKGPEHFAAPIFLPVPSTELPRLVPQKLICARFPDSSDN